MNRTEKTETPAAKTAPETTSAPTQTPTAASKSAEAKRPANQAAAPTATKQLNVNDLAKLNINELNKIAEDFKVEGFSGMRKQELIGKLIEAQAKQNGSVYGGGVLEILPDGFGFLRSQDNNYLSGAED
ncbi:MAG TPA: Rho termination factor N-terminal domain-containing protein, partial [Elusimicrobiales bacterium]|nr:Rho termination factor N-terminal domain-containing protein [Elusimicrobiales bacterium]